MNPAAEQLFVEERLPDSTKVLFALLASRRPFILQSSRCGGCAIFAFGLEPALYRRNVSAVAWQFLPEALVLSLLYCLIVAIYFRWHDVVDRYVLLPFLLFLRLFDVPSPKQLSDVKC